VDYRKAATANAADCWLHLLLPQAFHDTSVGMRLHIVQ
jgi:hypothetical protein